MQLETGAETPRADPLARAMIVAFALALLPAGWAAVEASQRPPALTKPTGFAQTPGVAALPLAPPPPVEPMELKPIAPTDAVAINAAVPFSTAANPAARPFSVSGSPADIARSTDCLAAAALYEAGDDTDGQRAVVQVIINRLRHPAFPKTVCGVVFEGSARTTGCQFTFTCDGAMRRTPSAAAWGRAKQVASAALTGRVDKRVGHATHYHTNWVVPYWSDSLDKITAVDTHLFFRWKGWWGTPPAFRFAYRGGEPSIGKMAALSGAHDAELAADAAQTAELEVDADIEPAIARDTEREGDVFVVRIAEKSSPNGFLNLALKKCGDRDYCKFMAWVGKEDAPKTMPIDPASLSTMAFSYLRDRGAGFEKALWNCEDFRREDRRECMKSRDTRVSVTLGRRRPGGD